MKFTLATHLLLVASASVDAFSSTAPSASASTRLSATVEGEVATSSGLKPPLSPSQIWTEEGRVASLYDVNVQKTYGRFPLVITKGSGCKLYDSEGKEYLDCVSGIATCALGHNNPVLTAAISKQMSELHHCSNLYLIPAQAALANWLCENSIGDKAFFCNSGAEANEAAIKCARRHASNRGITKPIIITAEQSFHGRTLAALTATGQPKYHQGFGYGGEMVPGFKYIPYNDIAALEKVVEEVKNAGDGVGLAGIMMEALQGEGGIKPGNPEFFAKIRELCDETGALMICDEVQVGMGRSGKLWGYENLNVKPDIFTSAKALGGGVPIGSMIAASPAADVFGPGDHASTYGGNPLACAAGVAVAQYFYDNNILDNVNARGDQLAAGLHALAEKYPDLLGDVRGWGLLKGIQIKDDVAVPGQVVQAALNEGLLLVGAGKDVVRFVPPLIITEAEMNDALDKFDKALGAVAAK